MDEKKKVGRPPRPRTNAQAIEEMKLGKFAECEPLHLPEKEIRRGWQIVGGVVLLLTALIGLYIILKTDPVQAWLTHQGEGNPLAYLPGYWLVMELMILLVTVGCVVGAVMMFMKKRVSKWLWYTLIAAAVTGIICASFHKFRNYEERLCYENYPGIYPEDPTKGSQCPSVVGDLSLIVLADLGVFAVGGLAIRVMMDYNKGNGKSKRTKKR